MLPSLCFMLPKGDPLSNAEKCNTPFQKLSLGVSESSRLCHFNWGNVSLLSIRPYGGDAALPDEGLGNVA